MLRFDYIEQENGQFQVTIVSEKEDSHSMAGKLLLEKEEWEFLWKACLFHDENYNKKFLKIENKGEQK